jgi:hypothetical protein
LGLLLLLLRVGVLESGMFLSLQNKNVRKGDFFMLFSSRKYFFKYIKAILIVLPTWYVIGILISFSKEFGAQMRIQGNIDPGKAVMYAYVAISTGDILVGFLSQLLKSRKQAVLIFYGITALSMIWYFNLYDSNVNMLYLVSAILGFGTGFWAIFVTMAAEQFVTTIRATVPTTELLLRPIHILIIFITMWVICRF